jgi:hypothetical protein
MKPIIISFILLSSSIIFSQNPQMAVSSSSKGQISNPVTLGVENIVETSINIYSFDKEIFISVSDFTFINSNISVFNLTGQRVLSSNISSIPTTTLNASNLKSGLYIVRTNVRGKQYQQKVFIK